MDDLQKNENDATIASMEQDSVTISAAAVDLISKVASSMVPSFNIFTSDPSSISIDKKYKGMDDEEKKSEHMDDEEDKEDEVMKSDTLDSVEGGEEEVNTEELLKSLTDLIDGKLTAFKEEIVTTVDEKIDTVVAKSADVEPEAEESLEKSDEAEGDKDELIKGLMDRIEKLESTGAVKKSLDDDTVDGDGEVIKKSTGSVWDGYFIPAEVVHALGYES